MHEVHNAGETARVFLWKKLYDEITRSENLIYLDKQNRNGFRVREGRCFHDFT